MRSATMRRLASLLLVCAAFSGVSANVARWAPDFAWLKSGGSRTTLKSLRGQPVVLVVAPSPEHRNFRKQAKELAKTYQLLGNDKAVMVAAFTGEPGVIRSNIPFVLAANPSMGWGGVQPCCRDRRGKNRSTTDQRRHAQT